MSARRQSHCKYGHALTEANRTGRQDRVCGYCSTVRSFAQKRGYSLAGYYSAHPRMLTEFFTHQYSASNGRV